MSTKVRCRECGKLLGELSGKNMIEVQPVACQVTSSDLVYTVKCPRCGKFNYIKIGLNE